MIGLLLAALPLLASQEASRQGSVRGDVRVERVVVDAYVTDRRGDPIPGLTAADFRIRVEGRPVDVESAEWIPAGQAEAEPAPPPPAEPGAALGPPVLAWPPGRVIVLFVQGDIGRQRTKGLMVSRLYLDRFLKAMLPTDRVAVVSFDSHLKLRCDFTSDPDRIRAAFDGAILFDEPAPIPGGPFPSLAANFDYAAAREASFVDGAMTLVAKALAPIPGAKALLYFGWGFAVDRSPKEGRQLGEAVAALYEARVNVFTLDVTQADAHTLETRLKGVSWVTGGTYGSTYHFPGGAIDRVARQIAGRYVLVFVKPEAKRGVHDIETELVGRKGFVSARTYYVD